MLAARMELNVVIGTITLALGGFVAASPMQAASIWGGERFEKMPAVRRTRYLRWYRVLGFTLSFAGLLVAMGGARG